MHRVKPRIAVEVGVWLGSTTEMIAEEMKAQLNGGLFIAIDTWQGAPEFRLSRNDPTRDLRLKNGIPMVSFDFLSNMVHHKVSDMVAPFAATSSGAAYTFAQFNIIVDLIHIDGDHSKVNVERDIQDWWPLLRPGGVMVMDDYGESWLGVVEAVNNFNRTAKLESHVEGVKWWVQKPW